MLFSGRASGDDDLTAGWTAGSEAVLRDDGARQFAGEVFLADADHAGVPPVPERGDHREDEAAHDFKRRHRVNGFMENRVRRGLIETQARQLQLTPPQRHLFADLSVPFQHPLT